MERTTHCASETKIHSQRGIISAWRGFIDGGGKAHISISSCYMGGFLQIDLPHAMARLIFIAVC